MCQRFTVGRSLRATRRDSSGLDRSNPPASAATMWPKIRLIVAVFVTACASQSPDQCPPPPSVTSAELMTEFITQHDFAVNHTVRYQCLSGYIWNKSTPDFITCQPNLTWSEPLISCKPNNCGDPIDIEDGYYNVTGRSFGHKATYYCNKGFELFGKREALCTNNGWSTNIPECATLPDEEEQLPTPSKSATAISTMRETTPQTNYTTTDGADGNHLLTSLPGSLPDQEQHLPAPSTNATTISTIRETTPQTNYITTDGADRNHLLSSLPGYTTEHEERRTAPSVTTTVNTIINKTIPPNNSPSFTDSLDRILMPSAAPNLAESSYEYLCWNKWIYCVVIICAIACAIAIVPVLFIIKVICNRRKYGSYKIVSPILEYRKDTELATIRLISN